MSEPISHDASSELAKTALHDLHLELGARMVPFAGYAMPVQFPAGVLKEHLHTRSAAGLFDVSHMGQIALRPKSGRLTDAMLALEQLVPVDVVGLQPGRQRYGFFTSEVKYGGLLDDLMIANLGDHLLLVVNAACKSDDVEHLSEHVSGDCDIEVIDRALLALQGPKAESVLAEVAPDCAAMRFMDVRQLVLNGVACVVSRSGYTGEDGFEISVPHEAAVEIATALLAQPDVAPIGLGARDSLRLEAGLCLSGADFDDTITPVAAGLAWAIQPVRRAGGARAGGFPGAHTILHQLENGSGLCRVGLVAEGRAPVRSGARLFASETSDAWIGTVTSGGFGPTVNGPVAMGYVPCELAASGSKVHAEVRGQRLAMTVTPLPFVPAKFKRN